MPPKFFKGDVVKYIGDNIPEQQGALAIVLGIRVRCSSTDGRPIYDIRWEGTNSTYSHGIFERNLEFVRKPKPKWRL